MNETEEIRFKMKGVIVIMACVTENSDICESPYRIFNGPTRRTNQLISPARKLNRPSSFAVIFRIDRKFYSFSYSDRNTNFDICIDLSKTNVFVCR